jgi:hypothetical protein
MFLQFRFANLARLWIGVLVALLPTTVYMRAAEPAVSTTETAPTVWTFGDVTRVDGRETEVLGAPRVVDGAAVFDGVNDGIFLPANPVAGRKAFTVEMLFSPASGGPAEQRVVHVQDDAGSRILMEIRLTPAAQWSLDTFLLSGTHSLALLDRTKEHSADAWHWVVLRYDGKTMTSFVDGVQQLQGEVEFAPMVAGKTSVGVRQNKVYWFKGAIREVRFTPAALPAEKLQHVKQG